LDSWIRKLRMDSFDFRWGKECTTSPDQDHQQDIVWKDIYQSDACSIIVIPVYHHSSLVSRCSILVEHSVSSFLSEDYVSSPKSVAHLGIVRCFSLLAVVQTFTSLIQCQRTIGIPASDVCMMPIWKSRHRMLWYANKGTDPNGYKVG
jgi:hypothetical protein